MWLGEDIKKGVKISWQQEEKVYHMSVCTNSALILGWNSEEISKFIWYKVIFLNYLNTRSVTFKNAVSAF